MADLYRSTRGGENDDVRRVKDASDIVRLIGEQIAIKPKGREYVCLCPFHNDHNPSMRVIPSKQIFHCFVCGTGGDVFSFIQKYHRMDFGECLRYLAERAGLTLTPRGMGTSSHGGNGEEGSSLSRRDVLDAAEAGHQFFKLVLKHDVHGLVARELIVKRGITPEMVERFGLGAAPDRFDGLLRYAASKNISIEGLLAAGLLKTRESGGQYDLLRHRLIFPIHDRAGRVIAFGGRKMRDEDEPKYINSPETKLFNKSATLYALHLAAKSIQTNKTALITEGYMDALACHQGGFTNAVATLGTALTREHAAILRTVCDTVVLLFDGDDAGQRAADRAVPIFFAEPIDVKIATLGAHTDAKDPDELLKREGGAEVFRKVLAKSVDLLEYRFNRVRASLRGAGMATLSKALMEEIDSMVQMGLREVEPIRQQLIIRRLAQLGNLDEATIRRAIPSGRSPAGGSRMPTREDVTQEGTSAALSGDAQFAENYAALKLALPEHLLGCLLCHGALWATMGDYEKDLVAPVRIENIILRSLAQCMMDIGENGQYPGLEAVLDSDPSPEVKSAAVALQQRVDVQTESDQTRLIAHWKACIHRAKLDGPAASLGSDENLEADVGAALNGAQPRFKSGNEAPPNFHGAITPELKPSGVLSAVDRIREAQRKHAQFGADRRVLPRKS